MVKLMGNFMVTTMMAELLRDNFAEGIRSGLEHEDLAAGYYKQARRRYLREAGVKG